MPAALFAAAGEAALENSTYALAIAACGAALREIIGYLRDRDAKRHDAEKLLLAAEVGSLKADVAELKAGLGKAEEKLQECEDDRLKLHEKVIALSVRVEAAERHAQTPPVAPRK